MPTTTPVITDVKASWRDEADCDKAIREQAVLANAWIDEASPFQEYARNICLNCETRIDCLLDAMADPTSFGMRGGFFFINGAVATEESRRLKSTMGIQAKTRQKTRIRRIAVKDPMTGIVTYHNPSEHAVSA